MRPAIWLLLFLLSVAGPAANAQCLPLPATSTVAVPVVSHDSRFVPLGFPTGFVPRAATQAPRRIVTLPLTSSMAPTVVTQQPLATLAPQAANGQVRAAAARQSLTRRLDSFAARLEAIRQRMNLPPAQNQRRLTSQGVRQLATGTAPAATRDQITPLLDNVVD